MALAVLVAWTTRLAAWRALDVDAAQLVSFAALAGLAADAALVGAATAVTRSCWRRSPILAAPVALAAAMGAGVIRGADLVHCALAGAHLTGHAALYASPDNLSLLLSPPLAGALWPAAGWLGLGVAALLADGALAARAGAGRRDIGALLLGAAALLGAVAAPASIYSPGLVPEANLLVQAAQIASAQQEAAVAWPPLWSRRRLSDAGLLPDPPLNADYPLTRGAEPAPFPYDARPVESRPNVVITFMEGINAEFLHFLRGRFRGVSPELDALSAELTVIDGYEASTGPTLNGLIAGLCSAYVPSSPGFLNRGRESFATRLACLPGLLRAAGYRTEYIGGASPSFSNKAGFLRGAGLESVYGRDELTARFPERHQSGWGHHDDTVVDFAIERMRALEAQREEDGRPFLLVLLTLDSHFPGLSGPDCPMPPAEGAPAIADLSDDAEERSMFRSVFCTDRAVGRLGRFLLEPERRDRTLWALTSDHSMGPGRVVRELSRRVFGRGRPAQYGPVPLLLHDPLHALPRRLETHAGSIDLAPTLLHVLGMDEGGHAMLGASIFGRRQHQPFVLGRIGPESVRATWPGGERLLPIDRLPRSCDEGKPLDGPVTLHPCDLLAWVRWYDSLWAADRLVPERPWEAQAERQR